MAETVNEYMETDLGNVAPNPQGDYSETAEYEYLDLVAYAGGSYLCIKEDGTISGTAPIPGKTTEIWQEVSRPGDLTPEYVAMHDDVVNKAASVVADAAQVAQNAAQIEGMKENVAALQEQTAQDAQLTKEYRESAAGYASAAETSRMAAGESEENVRALVSGFDAHVEEQKTSAQEDITTSRQAAIKAIAAQQVSSVNTVKQEGQKAINKTNADAEATAADRAAVSEMAATVDSQAAQVAQHAAQVAEDKVTVENYMQTAGESKKQALEAAERLKDSVDLVQKNTVDLKGKAPVIIGSATSYDGAPVEVNDSAEMQLQGLRLYGKSKQVVTTGKNLCSIKSCQLSMNIVSSDVIAWTKSSRVYYAFDTQNISGAKAYISIKYHDADKKIVGSNGSNLICNGTRKTGWFSGLDAQTGGSDIDLTTIEYISVQLGLYTASVVIPSFIDNIMVCDEENLPFEPYTGGKPSPSPEYPQEIENVGGDGSIGVEITGKNLFDLSKEYTSTPVVNTFTFTLKPSTKYTLSTDFPATANVASIYFSGPSSNINGVWKDRPKTFATDSSGNITVQIRTLKQDNAPAIFNDVLNGVYHIQLEEGNTATSYEPYKQSAATILLPNGLPGIPVTTGGNYTDENGQQYICDEIDFKRGKYVQRVWKGVLDGNSDEEWYSGGNYFSIKALPTSMSSREGYCNQYTTKDGKIRIGNDNNSIIIFDADYFENNLSNWKAHLAQHPLVVMTYLDAPIETDLTQEQLQAYKSLTTFKPTSIISNDAKARMNVEYAVDTETYISGLNETCNYNLDKISKSLTENKKADELTQRRLDALWKLNQGIVYEFQSDDADGYKKDVPTGGKYVGLKQIGGKSLVWGQLLRTGKHFFESVIKDHFYLLRGVANVTEKADVYGYVRSTGFTINTQANIGKFDVGTHKINCIIQAKENNSGSNTGDANFWCGSGNATFDNINLFDLTVIFGAGNEPSTVEEFEAMFPGDYYPYSEPEVVHAGVETVESVGRNLFNPDKILVGKYEKSTETWDVPNGLKKVLDMKFEENTQYTFSAYIKQYVIDANIRFMVKYTDNTENNTFLYSDSTTETYKAATTDAGKTIKEIWTDYGQSGKVTFRNLKIEKGTEATDYTPYTRNTLTIPESIRNLDGYGWSAGNAYNYVDFENKKIHKRVGCVDLGTLEWTYSDVTAGNVTFKTFISNTNLPNRKFQAASNDYLCAKYNVISTRGTSSSDKTISTYNYSNDNRTVVHDSTYTDVAIFKSAMAGVMLYYELAKEEIIDISDLLAELDEDAFVLPVEAGGTLTFKNSLGDGYRIPVPNSEEYILKLSEVVNNE